jgi:hypothetical protein
MRLEHRQSIEDQRSHASCDTSRDLFDHIICSKVQHITCTIDAIRSLTIRRNVSIYHNTMTRTKQTAKKSNGGSAPRVSLQVDTASAPAEENSTSDGRINRGDDKMEIDEMDDHNGVSLLFCGPL